MRVARNEGVLVPKTIRLILLNRIFLKISLIKAKKKAKNTKIEKMDRDAMFFVKRS